VTVVSDSPPDQPARQRITSELDRTLFVEAGAGSGKTTALVDRVVALVTSGVELGSIAAITFTEKAGAELRDRVRQRLQVEAGDPRGDAACRERCRVALEQLDSAAIGTLHSFAQRVLSEHPVEAQLPPRVEVLDEVTSGVQFQRRWERTLDEMLLDPALERTLLLLHGCDVEPTKLRSLALAFDASWDLVEDRIPASVPEPPPLSKLVEPIHEAVRELDALRQHCSDDTDRMLGVIAAAVEFSQALRSADSDELDLLEVLVDQRPKLSASAGRAPAWNGCKPQVTAQVGVVNEVVDAARSRLNTACLEHLGSHMRRYTLAAAHGRRRSGRLEFHDLLVLARKVLRDPDQGADVRRALHGRYQRLLLDEFQDTDPIQIELAVRIAAEDPAGADHPEWIDVPVAPGRLFVVGDPKQSIYRFRRADISTFLRAKDRFAPEAGGAVELTANFRTVEPIIHWVNVTFDRLMNERPETEIPLPSQPDYIALQARREEAPEGPAVAVLGKVASPRGTRADVLREAEARDVAASIAAALRDGWQVRDGDGWRRARLGDITILVPARTSLPFLEDALDGAGIPFRAESSTIVYASRAVRDLMMVLRAADDPTDHHRVVSALRTPLLACGDDDLYRYKVLGDGSWAYNTPDPPDACAGVVEAGLAFLREIHEQRHWSSPAELLDRIVRSRRALELGFVEGRPRDVWRRLRFVVDQARAWSEATGGSLRSYLQWVEQQTSEGVRVNEAVLPETDDDAVRVMTIHAAKGLEFPITIVSGLTTGAMAQRNPVEVFFPPPPSVPGYRLGAKVTSEHYDAWLPVDEQMSFDERVRLLYVACTRACDHLVVSLHRVERAQPPDPARRTSSELLLDGMGDLLGSLPELGGEAPEPFEHDPADAPAAPAPFAEWKAAHDEALALSSLPAAVAATALTDEGEPEKLAEVEEGSEAASDDLKPGLQKRPRDLDLPPWLKGRYGTAVGRAVHGVLQTVDLATGDGLDAAVAAQCQAEAVPERAGDVEQLVRHALGSPVVVDAAAHPHWREVYACTPIGDRLLEGYVDLLYRSDRGLVVVDHKTSASSEDAELDRRVEGYRLQGAAYAVALEGSTGEPVDRVVFLFLTPRGPRERVLGDLEQAKAEVVRLVSAGAELVTA